MVYDITAYGAVGDGATKCTAAIQRAIDDCAATGGQVLVPAGVFLSGSLRLRSHVDLHLEQGATLRSSLEEADVIDFLKDFEDDNPDIGWEGGCFLFARDETDISITGTGRIDGQGRQVFYDADAPEGPHECPLAVRGFRPRMTFLENVHNLTVRDVTFYDSAYWTLHMAGCQDVLIEGIRILNEERGPNNDGIDPDCCRNVVIRGCIIRAGDDAIVVKTTAPMAKKYRESANITISGCVLRSHSCALKIGTETWGDIHHITLSDCILEDCTRGFGIWSRDGGHIHDIAIHHVSGNTRRHADSTNLDQDIPTWWGKGDPVFLSATKREGVERLPAGMDHIFIDHLHMVAEGTSMIAGEDYAPIRCVRLTDFTLTFRRQSTSELGFFDERPSARGLYRHDLVPIYIRHGIDVVTEGDIQVEESMQSIMGTEILREALAHSQEECHIAPQSEPTHVREDQVVYGTAALKQEKRSGAYTLEDYLALPEERRVELIDGVFYDMAAPTTTHQRIAGEIFSRLNDFIRSRSGSCVPFIAPTDVQLDRDDRTIVEPDVFVVCDRKKIDRARIFGAPDLVIEILSPSLHAREGYAAQAPEI